MIQTGLVSGTHYSYEPIILAGAYIGYSKAYVSSDYDLENITKIAFNSGRDGNYEIYVMNADDSNHTMLIYNITLREILT